MTFDFKARIVADALLVLKLNQSAEWLSRWGSIIDDAIAIADNGRGRTNLLEAAIRYIDEARANWDDPNTPIPLQTIHEACEETGYTNTGKLKTQLRKRGYKLLGKQN